MEKVYAACLGALVTSLTMTPFDVIKTRLQTQASATSTVALPNCACNPYFTQRGGVSPAIPCPYPSQPNQLNSTIDAAFKIARHEGLASLWRGILPSLVMSVPSQAIYMISYDNLRFYLLKDSNNASIITAAPLLAGSVSRTAVVALFSPIELLRTRLQATSNLTALQIFRQTPVKAYWNGLPATLVRDVPFSAVYWSSYEVVRRFLSQGRGLGENAHGEAKQKTFGVAFTSGATSGMLAAALTHPFDVIKTRRQASSHPSERAKPTLTILREIAIAEGRRGLWSGLGPRIVKVAPACGIMIGAYEVGLRWAGDNARL